MPRNVFCLLALAQPRRATQSVYCRGIKIILLIVLTCQIAGSQPRGRGFITSSTDVAFAIEISPDGKTLAIARGALEPTQRFGRIELWDTETGSLRQIISGFDGPVRSISFTPDSKTIVSGSLEYHQKKLRQKALSRSGEIISEVKWWDVSTGNLKNKTEIKGEGLLSIKVESSPSGNQVAVVHTRLRITPVYTPPISGFENMPLPRGIFRLVNTRPTELRLLDAQSGEQKVKVDIKASQDFVFSRDGRFAATIGDNEVRIYNAETGKEVKKLKGIKGDPNALTFSPDSTSLAVVSTKFYRERAGRFDRLLGRSEVKIFNTGDWKPTGTLNDLGAVRCIAYEPSGRYLLIGGMLTNKRQEASGAVKIWDLKTNSIARLPTGGETYDEAVKLMTIGGKGRFLALASEESVSLIDITDNWKVKQTMDASSVGDKVSRPKSRFLLTAKTILEVAYNEGGELLTAETDQGEIKQWDPRTGELKFQLAGEADPSEVRASANSYSFAEVIDGRISLWRNDSQVRRPIMLPNDASAMATAFSGDGHLIAVAIPDQILLYDTTSDSLVKTLPLEDVVVEAIGVSRSGRMIAVAEPDGTISLLNVSDGSVRQTFPGTNSVFDLRFGPDDQLLAVAAGNSVNIYDVPGGALLKTLRKHDAQVNAVAFSSDGRFLASGSDDRTAIIWDIASGKSKRRLKGHDLTVRTVAFSPDGLMLASGSGNGSVVLWNIKKGKLNRVLH